MVSVKFLLKVTGLICLATLMLVSYAWIQTEYGDDDTYSLLLPLSPNDP